MVREVQIDGEKSILDLLKESISMYMGRKLKPVVRQRVPKPLDRLKDLKLMIHVIRANDVPIRMEYYNQYAEMLLTGGAALVDRQDIFVQKQVETFVEVRIVNGQTGEESVLAT